MIAVDDQVKMEISDNGIGIATTDQERIFERFYRVSTDNRHDIKGHGLGLSYVASVIRQHNGTIDLESELNSGSKFTIHLNKLNGEG